MALPLALMLAPTVLQLGTSIFSGLRARKMRKKMQKAQAETAKQLLGQTQMMQAQNQALVGGMANSYMAPMGMNSAQGYGPMRPGALPPMFS